MRVLYICSSKNYFLFSSLANRHHIFCGYTYWHLPIIDTKEGGTFVTRISIIYCWENKNRTSLPITYVSILTGKKDVLDFFC